MMRMKYFGRTATKNYLIADERSSQGKKKRQYGNDAVKSHILAARTVANIVKTSLVSRSDGCEDSLG